MSRPCKTPGHTRGHVHVRRPVFTASCSNRDAQSGSCAAVVKDQTDEFGKWKSHVCRYERPYVCKRPLNSKPDAPFLPWFPVLKGAPHPPCSQRSSLPPAAICPPGWLSFSGSCYWLVSNLNLLTTWHQAHTQCSDMGAHLLIVNR